MLHTRQKGAKTPESSAGRHPVVPEVSRPKDPGGEPLELPATQRFTSQGSLLRRGSAFKHLARDSQAQILTCTARKGLVCTILVDNIGVSLWLSWSKFTTFSIVMMSLCYLVPTVTLYILDLQPAGEQWKALSLILFSTVAILLLQLVKRSLRSADLNMALQKLDFCLMDSNTFYFQSIAACRYHVYFPLASIV